MSSSTEDSSEGSPPSRKRRLSLTADSLSTTGRQEDSETTSKAWGDGGDVEDESEDESDISDDTDVFGTHSGGEKTGGLRSEGDDEEDAGDLWTDSEDEKSVCDSVPPAVDEDKKKDIKEGLMRLVPIRMKPVFAEAGDWRKCKESCRTDRTSSRMHIYNILVPILETAYSEMFDVNIAILCQNMWEKQLEYNAVELDITARLKRLCSRRIQFLPHYFLRSYDNFVETHKPSTVVERPLFLRCIYEVIKTFQRWTYHKVNAQCLYISLTSFFLFVHTTMDSLPDRQKAVSALRKSCINKIMWPLLYTTDDGSILNQSVDLQLKEKEISKYESDPRSYYRGNDKLVYSTAESETGKLLAPTSTSGLVDDVAASPSTRSGGIVVGRGSEDGGASDAGRPPAYRSGEHAPSYVIAPFPNTNDEVHIKLYDDTLIEKQFDTGHAHRNRLKSLTFLLLNANLLGSEKIRTVADRAMLNSSIYVTGDLHSLRYRQDCFKLECRIVHEDDFYVSTRPPTKIGEDFGIFSYAYVSTEFDDLKMVYKAFYDTCKHIVFENFKNDDIISSHYVESLFIKHLLKISECGGIPLESFEPLLTNDVIKTNSASKYASGLADKLRMWTSYGIIETVVWKVVSVIRQALTALEKKLAAGKKYADMSQYEREQLVIEFLNLLDDYGEVKLRSVKYIVHELWEESQYFTYILFGISVLKEPDGRVFYFSHLAKTTFAVYMRYPADDMKKMDLLYEDRMVMCLPIMYFFGISRNIDKKPDYPYTRIPTEDKLYQIHLKREKTHLTGSRSGKDK